MRLALSTNWNAYRHETADAMLEEITALGFDTIELSYSLSLRQSDALASAVQQGRIHVSSVHAFCPSPIPNTTGPELFSLCDPKDFKGPQRARSALLATADFAAAVGAPVVVLHAGRVPIRRHVRKLHALADQGLIPSPKYSRQFERTLQKREKHAAPYFETLQRNLELILPDFEARHLTLGLENLPSFDGMPNEPEMQALLEEFDSPALGYWHDAGHAQIRQHLGLIHHIGILQRFADHIVGVHLHDVAFPTSDHLPPSPEGSVNFKAFKPLLQRPIPFVLEPARGTDVSAIQSAIAYLTSNLFS